MKIRALTCLSLCMASLCYSQSDFRQGYVITHAKDTVRGFVNYRQGAAAYRSCDFKQTKSAPATTYHPVDITGYGFLNDKFFQSRAIDSTNSQPVFLEVVVLGGAASLYRHEHTYFVEKDGQGLHVLKNESHVTWVNERRVKWNTNEFIGTSNILFFDCVELRKDIQRLKLRERNLTDLVEAYNKCHSEPSITFKQTKPWFKASMTLAGGISASTFRNIDALNAGIEPGSYFHAATVPVAGLLFDLSTPRLNERLAFRTGLFYKSPKYYWYGLYAQPHVTIRDYVTLHFQSLEVPLGVRYTFSARRILVPFVEGGLTYGFNIGHRNSRVEEREENKVVHTVYHNDISFGRSRIGYWIGAGSIIKLPYRFDGTIEFRLERSNHVMMVDVLSQINTFQVVIGIRTK